MKRRLAQVLTLLVSSIALSCDTKQAPEAAPPGEPDLRAALDSITAGDLLKHIRVLSSDEFEGRAPGTRGEELTVNYLLDQFKRIGLRPGNPDGSYLQEVPLIGITGEPLASFVSGGKKLNVRFPSDYVAVSHRFQPEITVRNSDIVFVGYGVVAPEYGWDDYKGFDVKGKTILMLINDPAVPDPRDPTRLDEKMFRGRAMTYYGRWTYKYEIASEKGASAAIIVHETEPAGYPYEVVSGSWGRENFDIRRPDGNMGRLAVESWVSLETAKKLCAMAGKDFATLKKSAISKEFKPVPFGVKANFQIKNKLRDVGSKNVIAKLNGSDPKLKDECVIYTAHWDHLGKDEKLQGDQIFNGALDNASGTSALLELAESFSKLSVQPKRTILFLSVTGEEKGLLGAKFYAENPLYPLEKTVADINIDGINQWGPTKDIVVIGLGNSTLDDVLQEEAGRQGRVMKPDAEPEKGFFYRSDHFEFALRGVPALYTDSGTDFIGKSPDYAQRKRDEYTEKDYHKVSDEIKPDWDLSGAVQDTQLLFRVGFHIAQEPKYPEWKPGTEFKAKREEMLRKLR